MEFALKMNGHICFTAPDKDQGFIIAAQHMPDIVIMDFVTPGMLCEEFVSAIRSKHPKVSFVLASGLPDIKDHGQNLGINCILQKPFDMESVLSVVQFLNKRN